MKRAKQNGQTIDLRLYSLGELAKLKGQSNFQCPYCQGPVRFRHGPLRKPHFSHVTPCSYHFYENESKEHEMAKEMLVNWLSFNGVESEMECRIPEIRRVADVYFEYEQKKYVIEIQKSPLTSREFEARSKDYESLEIEVLWIFIGEMIERPHTFILNRVMVLNKKRPLMHLRLEQEKLTLFDHVTWVTSKEVQALSQMFQLKNLTIERLLQPVEVFKQKSRQEWLEIKKEFRKYKWQAYMRHERALLKVCARHQTNLALLPAEVGWPVAGYGIQKSLFIWQAYVLLGTVMMYELGDHFTLAELLKQLKSRYHLNTTPESAFQIREYLKILERFSILVSRNGYYEYVQAPRFYDRLEPLLMADEKLSANVFESEVALVIGA